MILSLGLDLRQQLTRSTYCNSRSYIPVVRPKLTPPRRSSKATVLSQNLVDHNIVDYNNGDFATQSLTFTGIGRSVCDPRFSFFTAYYMHTQPGMRYRPPADLPIPQFTRLLGGRFAAEPEPEPKPEPNLGSVHRHHKPHVRSNWTQTKSAETLTSDASVQTEYRSRIDNFGLPPGLCLSAVIHMTRQRGYQHWEIGLSTRAQILSTYAAWVHPNRGIKCLGVG